MSNVFTERDADLVLSRGPLQLQYWHNPVEPKKEEQPHLYALKIVNVGSETLRDIVIAYHITEQSSPAAHVRFCDGTGTVLDDQNQKDSMDELLPGAHQFFRGRYWRMVYGEGAARQPIVVTHGFELSYKQDTKEVKDYLTSCPKGYFFIKSKLNDNVVDIRGASTAAEVPLISFPQKSSGTDNQLWSFEPASEGYFFIKSKLNGNVIDIYGCNTAAATPLISFPQKSSGTDNQLWTFASTSEGYLLIKSKLNGNVMDIKGSSTAAETPIISYPRNGAGGTNNQLWRLVPAG